MPPRPRLAASLLPSSDFPDVGNVVTYTLVMSNTGSAPANGAVMTNALPAGMTYVAGSVSATAGVASFVEGDRTVRWAGDLPVDAPVGAPLAGYLGLPDASIELKLTQR